MGISSFTTTISFAKTKGGVTMVKPKGFQLAFGQGHSGTTSGMRLAGAALLLMLYWPPAPFASFETATGMDFSSP